MTGSQVVDAHYAGEVDDPALADLEAREALFDPMGDSPAFTDGVSDPADTPLPWQVEVPPPIAVDLRSVQAALSPDQVSAERATAVVLLRHAVTAFGRPGEKPPPVWGIGYQVRLVGVDDAATLSWTPDTAAETLATASGHVDIGLDGNGHLGLHPGALGPALGVLAGLPIPDLMFKASTDVRFIAGFRLDVKALQIQAGPLGAGGARWNLYRRRKDLTRTQTLFHTVELPPGTDRLTVRLETWIRRRTRRSAATFGHFTLPPAEHDIPIRRPA